MRGRDVPGQGTKRNSAGDSLSAAGRHGHRLSSRLGEPRFPRPDADSAAAALPIWVGTGHQRPPSDTDRPM